MCKNILYKVTFAVSVEQWQTVKNKILSINFKDDMPTLTKHQQQNGFEYATFTSHFYNDLIVVNGILPNDTKIIPTKNIIR